MKPRQLTAIQLRLLEMDLDGATDAAIADALGIHIKTVALKRSAIHNGIAKGAYSNLPALPVSGDLFGSASA